MDVVRALLPLMRCPRSLRRQSTTLTVVDGPPAAPPRGVQRGINQKPRRGCRVAGELAKVDQAYKCRVRTPWWRVPLVAPANLLVTYMNADTPRLTTNHAGMYHLNSVHGVYLRAAHRDLGRDLLPLASLNTLTLLGAETVGRAYGGGMLKLEPREADLLPLPSPALVVASRALRMRALRPGSWDSRRPARSRPATVARNSCPAGHGVVVTPQQVQRQRAVGDVDNGSAPRVEAGLLSNRAGDELPGVKTPAAACLSYL